MEFQRSPILNGDISNDLNGLLTRFSSSWHFWSWISQKRCVLETKLLFHTNRKLYLTYEIVLFGDLDWPLNASRGLSATGEFLVFFCDRRGYTCALTSVLPVTSTSASKLHYSSAYTYCSYSTAYCWYRLFRRVDVVIAICDAFTKQDWRCMTDESWLVSRRRQCWYSSTGCHRRRSLASQVNILADAYTS